jgi:hypothetical protein
LNFILRRSKTGISPTWHWPEVKALDGKKITVIIPSVNGATRPSTAFQAEADEVGTSLMLALRPFESITRIFSGSMIPVQRLVSKLRKHEG